jgi:hypothetical protein
MPGIGIGISQLLKQGSTVALPESFAFTSANAFNFVEGDEAPIAVITTNREGAEIHLGYPAPAPDEDGEIIITPDAVGANPVTWYYTSWWNQWEEGSPFPGIFRSKFSQEKSIIIGDDTTKLNVSGPINPFWALGFDFFFGTTSGVYDRFVYAEYRNGERVMTDLPQNGGSTGLFSQVESEPIKYLPIPYGNNAPAPTNINITPDAVGDNPVTWYFKVLQVTTQNNRTLSSVEQSYTVGDSTTDLIFDCNHIDRGTVDLFIIFAGTTSGIYTNVLLASFTPPQTFVPIADVQLPFDLLTAANIPYGAGVDQFFEQALPIFSIPLYDNELFEIGQNTGELKFLSAPDFDLPLDGNRDNIYRLFVRASNGDFDCTQEIEVTVTESNPQ